ncbi:MAG: ribonuclease J [Moraxellaceae bacterium]|nr:ribonuclease J [Moraxellaceae bacterium]
MPSPRYQQIHRDTGPWVLPLGGCGQFGANFTLYGSEGVWIAIDCGLSLSHLPDQPMQAAVPSLQALEKLDIQLSAVLITHGHEDHIGAIPALWRRLRCPIYATPHAIRLISAKLNPDENGPRLVTVKPLQPISIGPFSVEWIPVTHSMPECHGIYLQVAGKNLYHTGDWKLDPAPMIGELTAVARLKAIGKAGIDVVIGDSTNATVAGHSCSEQQVAEALIKTFKPLSGRIVAACFASNVARICSLVQAGSRHNRHTTVLGRSLERHIGASRAGQYVTPNTRLLSNWEMDYLPRDEQLWLATGSQGEPRAALDRLAKDNHPALSLEAGDTVLFSSRVIPGNEVLLSRITASFAARGINIIDIEAAPGIHASGHPPQEDLHTLYSWLKPRYLLPVHGEIRHQQAHLALAKGMAMQGLLPRNGDLISISGQPFVAATTVSGLDAI